MKKKLLLTLLVVMTLVCLFTIAVSAEDKIVPSTSNEYGELTTFDEAIGNTSISNLKDDGTIARTVLTDGNGNYYTIPTVYTLTESYKNQSGKVGEMFLLSFDEISAKLGFTVSKNSIIRIEFPSDIAFICRNNENLSGSANVIEIIVNDGLRFWENSNQMKAFTNCKSLETIDLSGMIIEYSDATYALFENCSSLVSVKLPNAYESNGTPVKYSLNYMFGGCSKLETVENFGNLTKGVTSYEQNLFYNCNKLYNVTGLITDGIMVVPSNVTYFGTNAFQNCDRIRAIKFTSSSTKMLQSVFHSLDALEFISFPRDSKLELPSCEVFSYNAKLKAVAFPDDCTSIPDRGFKACPLLEAVYLPANLATLMTNGWDQGAFSSNPKLYFVNEWFDVLDKNGDFLLDSFVMPTRPDVYYFPSTLTNLFLRSSGGTGFYQCYKINPVLVFDTGVTEININDGLLIDCGTQGETKTAVFLGDMTQVCHSSQNSRLKNIQYVFANPNDKSTADVTITNNNTNNPGETAKIFFCASGTSYQMIPNGGTYGDSLGTTHFYLVEKETAPTCTVDGVKGYVCFCGVASAESTVIEATGHKASDTIIEKYFTKNEDGSINYFANMIKVCECTVCQENAEFEMADTALFATDKGYSFSETDASSISYTLHVNVDAIKAYLVENAGFKYGIVVSANTASNPISLVDGAINKEAAKTVIVELQGLT